MQAVYWFIPLCHWVGTLAHVRQVVKTTFLAAGRRSERVRTHTADCDMVVVMTNGPQAEVAARRRARCADGIRLSSVTSL